MPRPRKCRKVCSLPRVREFHAGDGGEETVILSVDEYETVRLIDKEGFSQQECAMYMQVARTTVQLIYNTARRKIAEALVFGIGIRIEGGDYTLCDGKEQTCSCGGCRKHSKCSQNKNNIKETIK